MPDARRGVQGRLEAEFDAKAGTTVAHVIDASAPLELRGPFAEGDLSQFYLRNVSCGVFAGDAYCIRLEARDGARAVVRGTAATKVHAMPSGCATSDIRIESSRGSVLAYYDGPTILQQGSDFTQRVEIVAGGGTAVYAEVVVSGRLARGETLDFRRYRSELAVRDPCDRAVYVERYDLDPRCDRALIADAAPSVFGKVIVAGAFAKTSFGGFQLSGDGFVAGYDDLPSAAGVVVRAAGEQLEPVASFIESTVCRVFGT